jgi:hypothetical protein
MSRPADAKKCDVRYIRSHICVPPVTLSWFRLSELTKDSNDNAAGCRR